MRIHQCTKAAICMHWYHIPWYCLYRSAPECRPHIEWPPHWSCPDWCRHSKHRHLPHRCSSSWLQPSQRGAWLYCCLHICRLSRSPCRNILFHYRKRSPQAWYSLQLWLPKQPVPLCTTDTYTAPYLWRSWR